jgi:hypothetical protein
MIICMIMLLKSLRIAAVAAVLFGAGYFAGHQPATVQAASERVYELRTYHCFPGKLETLKTRFRDHTIDIFKRHGMKSVIYMVPVESPQKETTLTYIISHASREQADANWKAFSSDPEWKKVSTASEANGKIVEKVDREYFTAADFSPIK